MRLFDASIDDTLGPVLVMEHIKGVTLEELMNRVGRFDVARLGRLLGPLCHALQPPTTPALPTGTLSRRTM